MLTLSRASAACEPCYCYPQMSPPTLLLCNGRDILKYPALAIDTEESLVEIHIGETSISCLPRLDSANQYKSLRIFSESLNRLWNCSFMEDWVSTLTHTHFKSACVLATSPQSSTQAATSTDDDDNGDNNNNNTVDTSTVGGSPTPPPPTPALTVTPGSPPSEPDTARTGRPTLSPDTAPPGRTTGGGGEDAGSTSGGPGDSGDGNRRQLAPAVGTAVGVLVTTAALVVVTIKRCRGGGSHNDRVYTRRLCECWRKTCYTPCCRRLRNQRTTPLEFTDFTYINEAYSSSSV